nr:acyltransferase family protein [uncultured Acetatifactor sp.]
MKSYEKRDRCHLEVLRIIAIFLVFYNHSAAFKVFETEHGMLYAISLLLSLLCKVAVPIFFMVSGALLLGKSEGAKELFQKRILRCVLVLVLFSYCYYMKLFLRGEIEFSVIGFLSSILQKEIFLPYWYLYAYLGFLLMLPILRPLAQNLGKGAVCYLIVLGILFRCILPVVQALTGFAVNSNLNISSIQYSFFR